MKKINVHPALFSIIIILSCQPIFASSIYSEDICLYTFQDTTLLPANHERLRLSKMKYKQQSNGLEKMEGIVTVDGMNIDDLVKDIFIGGNCFEATGISAPGGTAAFGEFYSGSSSVNIEEGIILASGMISVAHGPNTETGASTSTGTAGIDPDLVDLVNNSNLFDVAIIEFDFVPNDDSISFDYVFASEEYCDYVNSIYNDVFGFFLSGPGINGPFSNNAINIAVVPQTSDFVAINEVNWSLNSNYYVDNVPIGQSQGAGGCVTEELNNPPIAPEDIQFDGFTTVLSAKAEVIPCETYHIKLAIADVGDGLFDSAVFLKGNSFSAGSGAEVEIGYPDPRFEVAFEGCSNGYFYFERAGSIDINEPLTINFTLHPESTATAGVDYQAFPTSFTIPAGLLGDTLWIYVFDDLLIEGQETIIIELDNTCSCVNPIYELIIDEPEILDFELEDYEFCSPQPKYLSPNVTGGIPPYIYLWENGLSIEDRLVAPLETTTYYLTVTDQCGQEKIDSSTFIIIEELEASIQGNVQLCGSNPLDTGYLEVNFMAGAGPWGFIYSIDGITYSVFDIADNPYFLPVTNAGEYEIITVFMEDCYGQGTGIGVVETTEIELDLIAENTNCHDSNDGSVNLTTQGGLGPLSFDWNNGEANTEDIQNLSAGIYTVVVSDSTSCFKIDSIEIMSAPKIEIVNAELGMVNCSNEYKGFIDIEVIGGTDSLMYLWNTGEQTQDLNLIQAGQYSLTVTDAKGCVLSTEYEILADLIGPIIQTEAFGSLTCELKEVVISGNGSDEGADFLLNWSTSNGSIISDTSLIDIIVNEPGDYQLTITNLENGCIATEIVTVAELNNPPVISASVDGLITCQTSVVSIESLSSSVDSVTTYLWSTPDGSILSGANTPTPLVNKPGEYFVLITDTITGCSNTTSVTVLENLIFPVANAGLPVLFTCSDTIHVLNGGNSSGDNLDFEWISLNGSIISGENTPNPTINEPGEYQLIVTDTINGCTDVSYVSANVSNELPIVTITEPEVLNCFVDSVILNASGSSNGDEFLYTWTSITGSTIMENASSKPFVSEAGWYTLTIQNILNNCIQTLNIEVQENYSSPIADAGPSSLLSCSDTIVSLMGANLVGGSNYSYSWSTSNGNLISGQSSLIANVDRPGIYILEITDIVSGCIDTAEVEIFLDTGIPIAVINNDQILNCNIDQIQLDASASSSGSDYLLQWTTDNGNILSGDQTLQPTINQPGIYILSITNINNNCRVEQALEVHMDTIMPQIEIFQAGEINCNSLSQFIDATVNSGSGNYQIEWTTLDGAIVSSPNDLIIEVSQGGIYELSVIDNSNGCSNSKFINVPQNTEPPALFLSPDETINCYQPIAELYATTTDSGNYSYSWSTPNGNILTNPNVSLIEVDQSGTYNLTIKNLDNGCEENGLVYVSENLDVPNPQLNTPDTLSCFLEIVELIVSNVPNSVNYESIWIRPDGDTMDVENPFYVEVTNGGLYTFQVINLQNGCSSIHTVEVPGEPNPIISLDYLMSPPACHEDFGTIEIMAIEGGTGPFYYSIDGGVNFIEDSILNKLIPGSYSLIVKDSYGCEHEQLISIPDLIEVDIEVVDLVAIDFSEEYTIELEFNISLDQIEAITWTPNEFLSCSDCPNPTTFPEHNIIYHVVVVDKNGCEDEADIRIVVSLEPQIYIPNIFTPLNQDGTNDIFFINAKEGQINKVLDFLIFDRWGNRVFENFDFQPNDPSEGWDGTYNGKEINPAVFAYIAKFELNDGRVIIQNGDVTVVD
jgi:gliding motility-associated-like protein